MQKYFKIIVAAFVLIISISLATHSKANNFLGNWTRIADFGGTARQYSACFTIDSLGYVGLGADSAGLPNDFWKYSPATDSWNTIAPFPLSGRTSPVGFSYDSVGYIATGHDTNYFQYDLWQYNAPFDFWSQMAALAGTANPRTEAVGMTLGAFGYISMGVGSSSDYYNDVLQYDFVNNTYQEMNPIGNPPIARYGAVGFTIGNFIYIGTGIDDSAYFKDFWQYDPVNNAWTQLADFGGTARFGAVGFSTCQYGYVGLGEDLNQTYRQDFWKYDPTLNSWSFINQFPGTGRRSAVAFTVNNVAYVGTGWDEFGRTKDFYKFTCDSTSGVLELQNSPASSTLFPNPNHGIFEIEYDLKTANHSTIISVYDLEGRLVFNDQLTATKGTYKFNLTGFKNGIYFYSIKDADAILQSGKFVVGE